MKYYFAIFSINGIAFEWGSMENPKGLRGKIIRMVRNTIHKKFNYFSKIEIRNDFIFCDDREIGKIIFFQRYTKRPKPAIMAIRKKCGVGK
jgi:hypothetical protein